MGLFYAVGVTGQSSVFEKPPRLVAPKQSRRGPPRPRRIARNQRHPISITVLAKALSRSAFRTYTWRNGSGPRHRARVAALRVIPAQGCQKKSVHEACWLLVEKRSNETKYFLLNLPPRTSIRRMVEWIHSRWSIEQNYRELKNELGVRPFCGPSLRRMEPPRGSHRPRLHISPDETATRNSKGHVSSGRRLSQKPASANVTNSC